MKRALLLSLIVMFLGSGCSEHNVQSEIQPGSIERTSSVPTPMHRDSIETDTNPAFPASAKPMAQRLYQEYRSLGFLQNISETAFEAMLLEKLDEILLLEFAEFWNEEHAYEHVRSQILGRVLGLHQDWRFDRNEVVAHVNELLAQENEHLSISHIGDEPTTQGSRTVTVATDRFSLQSGQTLTWRYHSLAGVMEGINQLLQVSGVQGRFIGLTTDGDYYIYVYADPTIQRKLESTNLFEISTERDAFAGAVP